MRPERPLIVRVLLDPQSATRLTGLQWDLLIRQGRRANLLARLALGVSRRGVLESVPYAARMHLLSAQRLAERQEPAKRITGTLRNTKTFTDQKIVQEQHYTAAQKTPLLGERSKNKICVRFRQES